MLFICAACYWCQCYEYQAGIAFECSTTQLQALRLAWMRMHAAAAAAAECHRWAQARVALPSLDQAESLPIREVGQYIHYDKSRVLYYGILYYSMLYHNSMVCAYGIWYLGVGVHANLCRVLLLPLRNTSIMFVFDDCWFRWLWLICLDTSVCLHLILSSLLRAELTLPPARVLWY